MISPRESFPAPRHPLPGLPDFSCPGLLCTFRSCVLPAPSSERPERKERQGFLSLLYAPFLQSERGVLFPLNFRHWLSYCPLPLCQGGLAQRLGQERGKIPKGFPLSFLTHDRPFSCFLDRKERASLGAHSDSACSILLNFRLPLSSAGKHSI